MIAFKLSIFLFSVVNSLYLNRIFSRTQKPQELNYNHEVIIPKFKIDKGTKFLSEIAVKSSQLNKAEISHSRYFNRIDDNQTPDFGEYFGLPLLSKDLHTREWEYATNIGDGSSKLNMKF